MPIGAAAAPRLSSPLTGVVHLKTAGSQEWALVAALPAPLAPGDSVRTGLKSQVAIAFDDGSKVELGASAVFTLQAATPNNTMLHLGVGSLKAAVAKLRGRLFVVRTPTAVCSVRGTEFLVDVSRAGSRFDLVSGSLLVDDSRNQVLLKPGESVLVDDRGMGAVQGGSGPEPSGAEKAKEAMKREVGLEMSKEEVQAAAAVEAKSAIFQQGKALIDVNGNRVRVEEYIVRPRPDEFKLVVLNERVDRFDYFYYHGLFNKTLPDDISIALRQLPGCIGQACEYYLTGYDTARSNTIDNMLEVASGGHQVDVNNNGEPLDAVTAAFDPQTNQFVSVAGQPFFKTLFNNYRLTFNGVEHASWAPSALGQGQPGGNITNTTTHVSYNDTTQIQYAPACAPPNCTYTEDGVLHQVIYADNSTTGGDGSIWEKYESYIISDEGRVAKTSDFAGFTSGTQYKQALLNWNFQTIVTASEFEGRKIDLVVEPKIFIQSGLIP